MKTPQNPNQYGFTLIEIMIVVAIIAILAAIALPSYQEYVIKSNRTAATACLLEQTQFMERFYTTKLSYADAALPAGGCVADLAARYTLAFAAAQPTATTFNITATPTGAQTKDTKCGTLSINQAGTKTEGGTATSVKDCW